jgi:hypothetical protein
VARHRAPTTAAIRGVSVLLLCVGSPLVLGGCLDDLFRSSDEATRAVEDAGRAVDDIPTPTQPKPPAPPDSPPVTPSVADELDAFAREDEVTREIACIALDLAQQGQLTTEEALAFAVDQALQQVAPAAKVSEAYDLAARLDAGDASALLQSLCVA